MTSRRYVQLDVFADRPGAGNPLAVVLDAAGRFYLWRNFAHEGEVAARITALRGDATPLPMAATHHALQMEPLLILDSTNLRRQDTPSSATH